MRPFPLPLCLVSSSEPVDERGNEGNTFTSTTICEICPGYLAPSILRPFPPLLAATAPKSNSGFDSRFYTGPSESIAAIPSTAASPAVSAARTPLASVSTRRSAYSPDFYSGVPNSNANTPEATLSPGSNSGYAASTTPASIANPVTVPGSETAGLATQVSRRLSVNCSVCRACLPPS